MGALQWFFGQRTGWLAILGGAAHAVIFLGFVATVEHWGRDLRMEPIAAWGFLTLISCLVCFCVAYGAHEIAKFNTDRPWYDRAQAAEKANTLLLDDVATLRSDVRKMRDASDTLIAANQSLTVAAKGAEATRDTHASRLAWVEPRLAAAESWFDQRGKRIVTNMGSATVEDKVAS